MRPSVASRAAAALLAAAAAAAAPAAAAAGVYGVDVSQPVSASAAKCMAAAPNGDTFAVVRAWKSYGEFDANAPATMAAFAAAGVDVSVYLFPCMGLPAKVQLDRLQGNLTAAGATFTRMFFDIETNPDTACAWPSPAASCAYMKSLVAAALANPYYANRTGVYASSHEWGLIMGSPDACTGVANTLPLWYPHYSSPPQPNFGDFTPFGGWTTPYMKQYADSPDTCGVGTDHNWRPAA
jgi:hypothetical protein